MKVNALTITVLLPIRLPPVSTSPYATSLAHPTLTHFLPRHDQQFIAPVFFHDFKL
jgi:hypothetical protein